MSSGLKVFVTLELSPFNAGGIGRVVHNLLVSMTPAERETSVVLAVDFECDPDAFASRFPGARLVPVRTGSYLAPAASDLIPSPQAYDSVPWLWKSVCILRTLKTLAAVSDIAYVEFPDWGGFGFATIQEKLVHGFLSEATVAVRLHSSHGLLCAEEGYPTGLSDRLLADIERKCCRDCDLLIGQTAPTAAAMKRFYGFRDNEWDPRFVLHPPPVVLDQPGHPDRSIVPDPKTAVIFGSKLQQIKNPATFVRGCVAFLRTSPAFEGQVRLLAHDFLASYAEQIKAMVPGDLSNRFAFTPGARDRDRAIAQGISVLSSDFESYCLAAYEASLLGGIVVLNGANPAFGDGTPWIDGVNCIKYDGSALGLAAGLTRAAALRAPLQIVRVTSGPAPWTRPRPAARPAPTEAPLVSVVIPHRDLHDYVLDAIESCLVQDYPAIEIVVVDDCSQDAQSERVLDLLERAGMGSLTLCKLPATIGLSAARNFGISKAKGTYVVSLDADDLIHPRFVTWAVACLERNPGLDFVVPNARCFIEDPETVTPTPRAPSGYYAFVGEAFCSGSSVNMFGTSCALFRRRLFDEMRYDDTLDALEDWAFYLRAVNAGKRCAVMNQAAFSYRQRPDSLSAAFHDPQQFERHTARLQRVGARVSQQLPIQFLAVRGPEPYGRREAGAPSPDSADPGMLPVDLVKVRSEAAYLSGHLQARSHMLGAVIDRYRRRFRMSNKALIRDLIEAYGFFEPTWYRANYPELDGSDANLFEHFLNTGLTEQRMPNPYFNPDVYLDRYPDVRSSGMPAVVHFLLHGAREGRTY